jgi:hypothetical protein
MANDPEKTLQDLRQRIAAEGLPKLSSEALSRFSHAGQPRPLSASPMVPQNPVKLSEEALRLFREKGDSKWPWRR